MELFKNHRLRKVFSPIISLAFILIGWWLINLSHLINPLFIPEMHDTFSDLRGLLVSPELYYSLMQTAFRALAGLFLAILVGVPAGLLLARIPAFYDFFELPIEFFRSVPASALFPLFILFFGLGNPSKIAVVFYASSLILLVNSFYGAMPNPEKRDRISMLRTFGASNFQIFRIAVVRDAMPNISAGIRVCLSYSFALVVVTEMFLGANEGLGKMIYDYYLQYRIASMYAVIIILGFTGFFVNQLYVLIERKYIFWDSR